MEVTESALEVLSRAATMLQENQNALGNSTDENKSSNGTSKHLPTTKWKRERRTRLPEYSRKSDPKIHDAFPLSDQQQTNSKNFAHLDDSSSERSSDSPECGESAKHSLAGGEAPIDMSVKQRGLPPSYAQAISNQGYRAGYKSPASGVANGSTTARDELPSGISMCDPIIDEHFRRSLGKNYQSLFFNNNVSTPKEPVPTSSPLQVATGAPPKVKEVADSSGLSVDDHFAKALGDTWLKLNNKKDQDIKNGTSENHNLLSI